MGCPAAPTGGGSRLWFPRWCHPLRPPSPFPPTPPTGRQTGSSQRAGAQAQGPHQGQLPQPAGLRPLPPRREGEFMERGGSRATHPPGVLARGAEVGQGFPRQRREAASVGLSCGSSPVGPAERHSRGQILRPSPARSAAGLSCLDPASGTTWFFWEGGGGESTLWSWIFLAVPTGDSSALLGSRAGTSGAVGTLVRDGGFSFRDAAVGDVLAVAGALCPS